MLQTNHLKYWHILRFGAKEFFNKARDEIKYKGKHYTL